MIAIVTWGNGSKREFTGPEAETKAWKFRGQLIRQFAGRGDLKINVQIWK